MNLRCSAYLILNFRPKTRKLFFYLNLNFPGPYKSFHQDSIAAADEKFKEELRQHDMKLVTQLDQKLSEQQVTLERAGSINFGLRGAAKNL